ncbi:hypothetical protein DZF72_08090 [Vibrio parahaemolyticus]|nr:hypothetical protein [Vibrio parahaemolyticus]
MYINIQSLDFESLDLSKTEGFLLLATIETDLMVEIALCELKDKNSAHALEMSRLYQVVCHIYNIFFNEININIQKLSQSSRYVQPAWSMGTQISLDKYDHLRTESATRNAAIRPFFAALNIDYPR